MSTRSERSGVAARFFAKVQGQLAGAGYGRPGSIPPEMTFLEWCLDLAAKGLEVDGRPFTLDDRPSLIPLYEAIPTTKEQAARRTVVLMKGAQLGATVWEMLADLYMAIKFEPAVMGMFLPDQALAGDKSKRRFLPIVRSIPDVHRKLTTRIDGGPGHRGRGGGHPDPGHGQIGVPVPLDLGKRDDRIATDGHREPR